ncbi:unnamed protein product [Schistosoma margrebowiei]|uniref:Ig-like domain-containing protein n=1 Tax=Schistosoma margrebowiei TaxID=48269 RepID=A0AA85AIC6_9TREM|nr:unnamed protein product [Schistosoma margrebowiei]
MHTVEESHTKKPFVHCNSHVYGILGKSIILTCNVVSFLEINFTYPIWLHNGEYITIEDSYSNNNNILTINSTIENSQFPMILTQNFMSKYKIIHRKYSFGWLITLRINNLDLNDEGVYQCTFSNLMGSSSYEINLYLNHRLTRNEFIIMIVSCVISLLTILTFIIGLLYIQRKCKYIEWFNHHCLCKKCKLTLKRTTYNRNERSRYNNKTVGYFTAVDLSEVIQNSLIDDDHPNVINNKEINQSLNQPYSNDRVVPMNLLDDYVTGNPILHGQQSTLHEKFCCEYTNNTCQNQLNNVNILSESNCSTCSNTKPLILTNKNNNDHDSYVYHCCELKQDPLQSITNSIYDNNNPNYTIKCLHNKFDYESVLQNDVNNNNNNNNDYKSLNLNQTPLLNSIYTNEICLNELMSNSMINNPYLSYFKCHTKTNPIQRSHNTLPHHCMLYSNRINKNIHLSNKHQDNCNYCILKCDNSVLAPKLNETFLYYDNNKVLTKMNANTILDRTNRMCKYNHFNE